MPRGKRKCGQFSFRVWLPSGDYFAFESSRDLTAEDWRTGAQRYLEQTKDLIDSFAADQVVDPPKEQ